MRGSPARRAAAGRPPHRDLLLVLDNFEQVIAAAPHLTGLLTACPRLKILVTSRELLRVQGEQEFSVQPLAVPGTDGHGSPSDLLRHGAVALFVQQARAARPSFVLSEENADAVAAICDRLEGCRWRSNWPPSRPCALSGRHSRAVGESLSLLDRGAATCRRASRRCATPSPGVTTSSRLRSKSSSGG